MSRVAVKDICTQTLAKYLIQKYESPLYVYHEKTICNKVERLIKAADGFDIKYALKANTNSTIVKLIRSLGIHQVDVVSPGEVHKALQCGFKPEDIMYT